MDTLQCMRIFAKVAQEGGYAAAARKLNLTTPIASRAVSHLENRLGTRLLNRTTRSIALTEAGERYLRHCQGILVHVDEAEAEASSSIQHPSGCLKVHALSSFGHHIVLPASLRYQQQFPSVRVDLTFSSAMPDLVEEGYDASIILAPELPDSALINIRLGSIPGLICASPKYLAAHGEPRSPADLRDHHCLQLATPAFPIDKWIFAGKDATFSVDIGVARFAVNATEALEPAIAGGLGIGLIPAGVALPGLKSGSLVRVLPDFQVQPVNVYVLYQSRRFLDAKIRTWIDFLREDVPAMLNADYRALIALNARMEEPNLERVEETANAC